MPDTPLIARCFACGCPCELPVMIDVHGIAQPVCTVCVDRTVAGCRRLCDALAEAFAKLTEAFLAAAKGDGGSARGARGVGPRTGQAQAEEVRLPAAIIFR